MKKTTKTTKRNQTNNHTGNPAFILQTNNGFSTLYYTGDTGQNALAYSIFESFEYTTRTEASKVAQTLNKAHGTHLRVKYIG